MTFLRKFAAALSCAGLALAQQYTYPGVGNDGDGAALVIGQIGGNSRPDMLLLANDDGLTSTSNNSVRYRLLRDLSSTGVPASQLPGSTSWYQLPITPCNAAEGMGAALTELNGNTLPDLVVLCNDSGSAVSAANVPRWFVAYDLNSDGRWTSLGALQSPPAFVSFANDDADGAGVAIGQIDANPAPDMIVMAFDQTPGANVFRYRIGFNLNASAVPASWSTLQARPVSSVEADGADMTLAQLDSDPRPDLVLMHYDDPFGSNNFRTTIGWNLNTSGLTLQWTDRAEIPVGPWGTQRYGQPEGAGIAIANLNTDPRPDFVFMSYDYNSTAPGNLFFVAWERDWPGTSSNTGIGCSPGVLPRISVLPATVPTENQLLTLTFKDTGTFTMGVAFFDLGGPAAPIDLTAYGLPGCNLYASSFVDSLIGFPFPTVSLFIPPGFAGQSLYAQGFLFGGPTSAALTNRLNMVIGR
ncbi:MAG: hypothetical protein MUC36_10850 [Planctomycetes bacterium]|nr:hypothetical protein [Planctomycetota bacterium]